MAEDIDELMDYTGKINKVDVKEYESLKIQLKIYHSLQSLQLPYSKLILDKKTSERTLDLEFTKTIRSNDHIKKDVIEYINHNQKFVAYKLAEINILVDGVVELLEHCNELIAEKEELQKQMKRMEKEMKNIRLNKKDELRKLLTDITLPTRKEVIIEIINDLVQEHPDLATYDLYKLYRDDMKSHTAKETYVTSDLFYKYVDVVKKLRGGEDDTKKDEIKPPEAPEDNEGESEQVDDNAVVD